VCTADHLRRTCESTPKKVSHEPPAAAADRPHQAGAAAPPRRATEVTAEAQLTVAEVAKLWRCSRNLVYDLISSGRLKSVNLTDGRAKTRIPESALAEYIAARTRNRSAA
jgi:excisionase family DNA binding protein